MTIFTNPALQEDLLAVRGKRLARVLAIETEPRPRIVTDPSRGRTLAKVLPRGMSAEEIVRIYLNVLKGLEALHRQGLCHLNLSADNVLLRGEKVFLTGFEHVNYRQTFYPKYGSRGCYIYTQREEKGLPDHHEDIRAAGMLLEEMLAAVKLPSRLRAPDRHIREYTDACVKVLRKIVRISVGDDLQPGERYIEVENIYWELCDAILKLPRQYEWMVGELNTSVRNL